MSKITLEQLDKWQVVCDTPLPRPDFPLSRMNTELRFVRMARIAVPELIAEVRRLQARNEELQVVLSRALDIAGASK